MPDFRKICLLTYGPFTESATATPMADSGELPSHES